MAGGDAQYKNVLVYVKGEGAAGSVAISDLSPIPKTIAVMGDAKIAASPSAYAAGSIGLDGAGDYLAFTSGDLQLGFDDFTVEAWGYFTEHRFSAVFSTLRTDAGNGIQLGTNASGVPAFLTGNAYGGSTATGAQGADPLPLNTMIHIAGVRRAGVHTLYINGIPTGSSVTAQRDINMAEAVIGRYYANTDEHYMKGFVGYVRVTLGARYTDAFVPPAAAPDAFLPDNGVAVLPGDKRFDRVSLYLKGEGAAGTGVFKDSSPSSKVITTVGAAQHTTSVSPFGGSSAIALDGAGSFLRVAPDESLNFGTGDFCIDAWIYKTSDANPYQTVFANKNNDGAGTSGRFLMVYSTNSPRPAGERGKLVLGGFGAAGNNYVISKSIIDLNKWYHVAAARRGTTLYLFLNGVLEATATTSDAFDFSFGGGTVIGANGWDGNNGCFTGALAGVRATKGVPRYMKGFARPVEITAAHMAGKTLDSDVHASSRLLLLRGNGVADSSVITDLSVRRNVLTAYGGVKTNVATSKWGGSSLDFDGSGYILGNGAASYTIGTADFTVEFWLYPRNLSSDAALIDFRPFNTNGAYPSLSLTSSGGVSYYVDSTERISGAHGMTVNTWHHFALCRVNGVTRVFVNGAQVGSSWADTYNYSVGANRPVIGALGWSETLARYNGLMEDLRVSSRGEYGSAFTPPQRQAEAWTPPTPTPGQGHRHWRIQITANNGDSYTDVAEVEWRDTTGRDTSSAATTVVGQSTYYDTWDARRTIDENRATDPWVSNGALPHWLTYDFGESVNPVELAISVEAYAVTSRPPKDFVVMFSDDGLGWTPAATFTSQTAWTAGVFNTYAIPDTNAGPPPDAHRYWRIYITANNGDGYTCIAELQVRNTWDGEDLTYPGMPTAQSSNYPGRTAAQSVDNVVSAGQSWLSQNGAPPHWVAYDFGSPIKPVEMVMTGEPGQPNRSPKNFTVQWSDTGLGGPWTDYITINNAVSWTDAPRGFAMQPLKIEGYVKVKGEVKPGHVVRVYKRIDGTPLGEKKSGDGVTPDTFTYSQIAGEGGSFTVSAGQKVRYGADSRWFEKTFTASGTYACNSNEFGGDPAYGTAKTCQLAVGGTVFPIGFYSFDLNYGGECIVLALSTDENGIVYNDQVKRVFPE